ncbi:MAG TPA: hypothetical protein VKU02_03975 [Gemmataceae bacterium]|nr:hypothetical protein [Gemmataceae bacterium]
MRTALWRGCLFVLAVALLGIYGAPAQAQSMNLALNKPVIDESSQWSSAPVYKLDPGLQYAGSNITDGNVCELDQNEGGNGISSYWIGAEGKINQTLTLDLEAPTLITEIHLRNTHNAQFNDRNTMDFQIDASLDIQVCSDASGTRSITNLVNPVTILVGTLSSVDGISCPDEIPPDIFDSTNGLTTAGQRFRYLQFTALDSYHASNNVGLNELEVYGSQ